VPSDGRYIVFVAYVICQAVFLGVFVFVVVFAYQSSFQTVCCRKKALN